GTMANPISVVVPTKNSASTLRPCLESIRRQSVPIELIVVDNGSTDGTSEIARGMADIVLDAGPERTAQRNAGAARASGNALAFFDSDMVLERDVVEQSIALLADPLGPGALVVPERSFGKGYWAACRSLEKSLYTE